MKRAYLSDQAKGDLIGVWKYVARDNQPAADRLLQAIDQELKTLSQHPGIGRLRDELRPSLRSVAVGNYLVLYRSIPEGIAVIRIVHGARDVEALLDREPSETYQLEDNGEPKTDR